MQKLIKIEHYFWFTDVDMFLHLDLKESSNEAKKIRTSNKSYGSMDECVEERNKNDFLVTDLRMLFLICQIIQH